MIKLKIPTAIIIIMVIQMTACSSTRAISTPEQLNRTTADNDVTIILKSGEIWEAQTVFCQNDSIQCIVTETNESKQLAISEIKAIQIVGHGTGATIGFLWGVTIGGIGLGIAASGDGDVESSGAGSVRSGLLFGGATLGGVIGAVIGAIIGKEMTYTIVQDNAAKKAKTNP